MKAVIMAGGLGTRLRPLTKIIPKPLLPLGEKSILDIIIASLSKGGVSHVILATNYKSEMFHEYFADGARSPVSIQISKENDPLGTAGHLSLLKDDLQEPFIVTNGDILTDLNFRNLLEFHKSNNADLTIVSTKIETPLQYGVIKEEDGLVKDIHEKPNIVSEVLAGVYVVSPKVLALMQHNEKKLMTDLIRESVQAGLTVKKFSLEGYWLDIGQMKSYQKALSDISTGSILV
jgi:NDP-mannose synthase